MRVDLHLGMLIALPPHNEFRHMRAEEIAMRGIAYLPFALRRRHTPVISTMQPVWVTGGYLQGDVTFLACCVPLF